MTPHFHTPEMLRVVEWGRLHPACLPPRRCPLGWPTSKCLSCQSPSCWLLSESPQGYSSSSPRIPGTGCGLSECIPCGRRQKFCADFALNPLLQTFHFNQQNVNVILQVCYFVRSSLKTFPESVYLKPNTSRHQLYLCFVNNDHTPSLFLTGNLF